MPVAHEFHADAAVIGGGIAGLATANWLGRHRRKVVVFDRGEPRARYVETSHGYVGLDPIKPLELLGRGRAEALAYPTVEICAVGVRGVQRRGGEGFELDTDDGVVSVRRVVLCAGLADAFPDMEGFFDHYGADVYTCATCDGYDARECHVVVLGWSAHVAGFALGLLDWAAKVTIVTEGLRFEGEDIHRDVLASHGVEVVEKDAVKLLGPRGALEGVVLDDESVIRCQKAFFSIAHHPTNALAEQLGCAIDAEGYVCIDEHGQTSVEGVYAAGDITPGPQLLLTAAAQGALAGVYSAMSLRGEAAVPGAPAPGPDVEAELAPPEDELEIAQSGR